jgi:2-oxoglutarate dehydrogenase E1 component
MSREQAIVEQASSTDASERIWNSFRRWGYLQAHLDPIGDLPPVPVPELDTAGAQAEAARRIYCGTIGAEFMHIPDPERRLWVQERMESLQEFPLGSKDAAADRARILGLLVRAEIFEQVLQTRYLGTKRYSLEGEAALLPERGFRARRGEMHAGHEPSRAPERDGAHRGTRSGRAFYPI